MIVMICPNCKEEYREGFTLCVDCGENLIEKPPEPEPQPVEMVFADPTFLYHADDDAIAGILISALEEGDIPVMLKKPGAGEYLKIYMNMNAFGMEIHVPAVMLEKAREVLVGVMSDNADVSGVPTPQDSDADDLEFQSQLKRSTKTKRMFGRILFAFFFGIPALVVLIIWIVSQFNPAARVFIQEESAWCEYGSMCLVDHAYERSQRTPIRLYVLEQW